MLKELLKPEIQELIEHRSWTDLKIALSDWPAPEIADLLLDVDKPDRVLIFRALPRSISSEVFSHLAYEQRDSLLYDLTDDETKQLLTDLSPDDRTDVLEELPAKVTTRLLMLLSPEDLKEARSLLGYPEYSIGREMTPDFVAIRKDWTVDKAISHIRLFGKDSETINRIYVVDNEGMLLDDILLRYILLAANDEVIENLMDYNVVSISAFDDQEKAVRVMEKYDISALPVVDSEGHLVGIVTFDDIMDISQEETTEDFHKISGINPVESGYLYASIWRLCVKRFPWLFLLMFASSLTSGLISLYDHVIEAFIALTFFLPMLIGTAGNTGTQSATLIIRSLAIEEVQIRDWFRVFIKEFLIGMILGAVLGVFTYFRGYVQEHQKVDLALIIGVSMMLLVLWANLIGALLPLLLKRLKLDPAVISSPFIATLIDATGILIYFNVAMAVMS